MLNESNACKMLSRRHCRAALLLLSLTLLTSTVFIFTQQWPRAASHLAGVADVLLDRRSAPSDVELEAAIERELPSLPYAFYRRHRQQTLRYNASCAPYPDLSALHYRQDYWQLHCTGDVQFHLFGAYYDKRPTLSRGSAFVRLLAMINRLSDNYTAHYCQLWFDEHTQPLIVSVSEFRPIWTRAWGHRVDHLYPHLLGCALPARVARNLVPQTVSLVAAQCARASNNLRIVYRPLPVNATRRGFAVCVKGLDYPYADMSARLVEWLELLRLLGAEKVIAYELQLHANTSRVLRHYQRSGYVDLRPLTLARNVPSVPHFRHQLLRADGHKKRLNELIPYNDCFYRNMYRYEYIAVLDIDEVIMPLGNLTSWRDLVEVGQRLRRRNCRQVASFCFRNIFFPDYPARQPWSQRVPAHQYMLQHVLRVQVHQPKGIATKCLHNTAHVLTLHNHFPFQWTQCCMPQSLNETLAQLQHYREPLYNKSSVATPVLDHNIWRFKESLVERTRHVLGQLGFLDGG